MPLYQEQLAKNSIMLLHLQTAGTNGNVLALNKKTATLINSGFIRRKINYFFCTVAV